MGIDPIQATYAALAHVPAPAAMPPAPSAAGTAAVGMAAGMTPNALVATGFDAPLREATLGKRMSARERFATLQQRFRPEAARGVNVSFQFNLTGPGGGKWFVTIRNGKLTVKEGTGPNPTATLTASAEDYVKMAEGEMNKMVAFVRGRLKVEGDRKALEQWDTYFRPA